MVRMPYHLKFHSLHNYDPAKSGITVPVTLRAGGASVALNAKIDTGATYCIFQRLYGEPLGLDIERGHHQLISTPTGSFAAYVHTAGLSVLGFEFDAVVYSLWTTHSDEMYWEDTDGSIRCSWE
jgi:hypothetical protein